MELISKVTYRGAGITLRPGVSTASFGLSEARKAKMLEDFPDWFEVVEEAKEESPVAVEKKIVEAETLEAPKRSPRKKKAE